MPHRHAPWAAAFLVALCATGCASPAAPSAPTSAAPATTVPTEPVPTGPATTGPATTGPPAPNAAPGLTLSTEDTCVAATMAAMSMQQLVGQLMIVGTPVTDPAGITATVTRYHVGSVFLAGRSHAPAAQVRAAIASIQAAAPPGVGLLVGLDQEGGQVQTLQGTDFPPIPTALDQGRLGAAALHAQAVAWAGRLAGIGVTLDLAPVADTVPATIGTANPPIGAFYREYGSDPAAVAADIDTLVDAVQSTGVITTLKHFPGLGRVRQNTDTSTGAVDGVTTAHDPYLAPFQAGIGAGTGAVMMSSASYPQLDPNEIAVFSAPIVTGLLRGQLGFDGLVISDDLGNAVAVSGVPVGQRAVRFVEAGGDLALTVNPATAAAMVDGLLTRASASPEFAAKVAVAGARVLRAKYGAGLLACSPRP